MLADAGVRLAELDARFAAAHPGLTEALRAHVAELMSGRDNL
jgi:hypothetical protein